MDDFIMVREIIRDVEIEVIIKKFKGDFKIVEICAREHQYNDYTKITPERLLELSLWYTGQFDDFIKDLRKRFTKYAKDC